MAEKSIENLQELLVALGRERNLRGRLRVLGHAWQLLRELSPPEREQVALRIGSNWAWKRVEKSFLRDGDLDEDEQRIGRIFERLGDSDPAELRAMASALREGDRDAAKDMLLMTLQEALEEEAEEDEASRVAEQALEPIAPAEAADLEADLFSAPPPVAPPTPRVPFAVDADVRAADPAAREAPAPRPAAGRAVEVTSAPVHGVAPAAPPRVQRPEPALAVAPAAPVTNGLERMRLLRRLRDDQHPGAALGRAGRQSLIASLGGGWASRRALSSMIRGDSLEDVDEGLALISQLERSGQRVWCLADLLELVRLDSDARERVLSAAPSDASRRRLAQRPRR